MVGTPKPGLCCKRVNQRFCRNARRCDACRKVQQRWVCLVEVADSGFVHQCEDEPIEIYKLCKICFVQVQGLLDGDLIWQLEEEKHWPRKKSNSSRFHLAAASCLPLQALVLMHSFLLQAVPSCPCLRIHVYCLKAG